MNDLRLKPYIKEELGLCLGDTPLLTPPLLLPYFDLILPTKSAISLNFRKGGQKRGYPLNIGLITRLSFNLNRIPRNIGDTFLRLNLGVKKKPSIFKKFQEISRSFKNLRFSNRIMGKLGSY